MAHLPGPHRLEVRAQLAPWARNIECMIGSRTLFVEPLQIKVREDDHCIREEPTFSLEMEQAQTLMDDLWNCGIRPTEGAGSAGAMRATERHLEDMRKLVFEGRKK